LELGGKNAAIVFPTVDLNEVMPTIVRSCFANQGEICLCTSRLFVHQSIFERFVDELVKQATTLRVGDPESNDSDLGALISKSHLEKVAGYIQLARNENGVKVLCGGATTPPPGRCQRGYFLEPTVIVGARDDSRLMREEIFGPVVCVSPFDGIDEVIQRANSVSYGLSASVWSKDVNEITEVSSKLKVGTVWCNCWLIRELNMPFGGTKESGIGREGVEDSLHFFTEAKTICLKMG